MPPFIKSDFFCNILQKKTIHVLFISLTDGLGPAHLILPVLGYKHKP